MLHNAVLQHIKHSFYSRVYHSGARHHMNTERLCLFYLVVGQSEVLFWHEPTGCSQKMGTPAYRLLKVLLALLCCGAVTFFHFLPSKVNDNYY